jgi:hypothetical protein
MPRTGRIHPRDSKSSDPTYKHQEGNPAFPILFSNVTELIEFHHCFGWQLCLGSVCVCACAVYGECCGVGVVRFEIIGLGVVWWWGYGWTNKCQKLKCRKTENDYQTRVLEIKFGVVYHNLKIG